MAARFNPKNIKDLHVIAPGGYSTVHNGKTVLKTLLGSCVAVCLYDPVHGITGMNHFLLSCNNFSLNQECPYASCNGGRCGAMAMQLLIKAMEAKGASLKNLRAKAFGGANVLSLDNSCEFTRIGEINTHFTRHYLQWANIPLEAEDMGGESGRVIYFTPHDYSVYSRTIEKHLVQSVESEKQKVIQESCKPGFLNMGMDFNSRGEFKNE